MDWACVQLVVRNLYEGGGTEVPVSPFKSSLVAKYPRVKI